MVTSLLGGVVRSGKTLLAAFHRFGVALNLVEGTVKRHLHNVYDKLEVGSRSEAVRKALSEGWISARDFSL